MDAHAATTGASSSEQPVVAAGLAAPATARTALGLSRDGQALAGRQRRRITVTTRPNTATSSAVNTMGDSRGLAGSSVTVFALR